MVPAKWSEVSAQFRMGTKNVNAEMYLVVEWTYVTTAAAKTQSRKLQQRDGTRQCRRRGGDMMPTSAKLLAQ